MFGREWVMDGREGSDLDAFSDFYGFVFGFPVMSSTVWSPTSSG